ncbi:MAG: nucleotidyl transferase AbiEii/AbiGii toxin family protein [Eggerthellaceae bacterium]|nr:nucleotidyl transferase AbiEii/AbiGii toxin family protein [Eggerthellaceae bacterium]
MLEAAKGNSIREVLESQKPKNKEPINKRVLDSWIDTIENTIPGEKNGRLAWLVASAIVAAVLQKTVDGDGKSRFLMKGGTFLQHRLGDIARSTRDLDGLVRGNMDDFISSLDSVLQEQWGLLQLVRGEVETIETPAKIIKPRSFTISINLKGETWRKITVEVSPEEGRVGEEHEYLRPPALGALGLPTPDVLVTLAMRYQIAQKVHSATDPHDPPLYVNNRPRDVVDLLLIRNLVEETGEPSCHSIREAILDVFTARAEEANTLGRIARSWPARAVALPNWFADYSAAAETVDLRLTLEEAVDQVNEWLDEIDLGEGAAG